MIPLSNTIHDTGIRRSKEAGRTREGVAAQLVLRLKSLGIDFMLRHRSAVEARLTESVTRSFVRCLSKRSADDGDEDSVSLLHRVGDV